MTYQEIIIEAFARAGRGTPSAKQLAFYSNPANNTPLAGAVNVLNAGGSTDEVISGITSQLQGNFDYWEAQRAAAGYAEISYADAHEAVRQRYKFYLEREPTEAPKVAGVPNDPAGWEFWTQSLLSGASAYGLDTALQQLNAAFQASAEYLALQAAHNAETAAHNMLLDQIRAAHQQIFGRAIPDADANWWAAQGLAIEEIVSRFHDILAAQSTGTTGGGDTTGTGSTGGTGTTGSTGTGTTTGTGSTGTTGGTGTTPAGGLFDHKITLPVVGEVPVVGVAIAAVAAFFLFSDN